MQNDFFQCRIPSALLRAVRIAAAAEGLRVGEFVARELAKSEAVKQAQKMVKGGAK